MSTIVIVSAQANPDEQNSLKEYSTKAGELIMKAGGRVLKKAKLTRSIKGTMSYNRVVLFEFPNEEAVDSVFLSSEYKDLLPLRDLAFLSISISIGEEI